MSILRPPIQEARDDWDVPAGPDSAGSFRKRSRKRSRSRQSGATFNATFLSYSESSREVFKDEPHATVASIFADDSVRAEAAAQPERHILPSTSRADGSTTDAIRWSRRRYAGATHATAPADCRFRSFHGPGRLPDPGLKEHRPAWPNKISNIVLPEGVGSDGGLSFMALGAPWPC